MVPLYGTLVFLNVDSPVKESLSKMLLIVGGLTFVVPIFTYYYLKQIGKITSTNLPHTRERWIPLLINAILLLILAAVFRHLLYDKLSDWFILLAIQNSIAMLLLLVPFKTSIHLFNNMSLILFLGFLSLEITTINFIMLSCLWISLIGMARLMLKAHRPVELLIGGNLAIGVHASYFFWFN